MLTTKTHTIRVLLVDDHEVIRVGLRTVLGQTQGVTVVGEAGTMAEAVQQTQKLKPDVVLMDVRLPDGSGVDACREILGVLPGTRVIFLTSYADDDSVLAAVLAGAHGYVLKEIDSPGLLEAIRSVARGQSILDSGVTERALRWLRGLHDLPATPGSDQLSSQEERVVALVAEGKTNKEIAVALGLSDKTVKNYLANVFQKLRITRRAQAAAFFVKRQG
ncbi:MAG: response regulator transcription factor [Nitrospira sp.]